MARQRGIPVQSCPEAFLHELATYNFALTLGSLVYYTVPFLCVPSLVSLLSSVELLIGSPVSESGRTRAD